MTNNEYVYLCVAIMDLDQAAMFSSCLSKDDQS